MIWRVLLMRSMRSIDFIAEQLRERNPLDFTPLRVQSPPEEMQPILLSLETIFERMRNAISFERRFTSVAAHEMRTPLAGLRAQAQLACSATDPGETQKALQTVKNDYESALLAERTYGQNLEAAKADVQDLSRKSVGYNVMEREAKSNRTIYESLLQREKELRARVEELSDKLKELVKEMEKKAGAKTP